MKAAARVVFFIWWGLAGSLFSQERIQEQATVINIEVPVRVFHEGAFVDNLTIDDFEVLENGVPQKIEAVYFVKKRSVERSEERKRFNPQTTRNFFLFFEISDYTPQLGDAVRYFVEHVLAPGDHLSVITSMNSYRMKDIPFEVFSRERITQQLIQILRRDTLIGNAEYRSTVEQISALSQSLSVQLAQTLFQNPQANNDILIGSLNLPSTEFVNSGEFTPRAMEEQLTLYANYLFKLDNLRRVDQGKILNFARYLRNRGGQKYVFLFYQKEYIPQIDPKILNQFMTYYQDRPIIMQTVSDLMEFYKREIPIDSDLIEKTYADCSISIHFLYLTLPPENVYGVRMEEHSEDIYASFQEMARATGGYADSAAWADSLFKRALEASENYYIIYYSPHEYKADGKFRNIRVRIKSGRYKVLHRMGYYAN